MEDACPIPLLTHVYIPYTVPQTLPSLYMHPMPKRESSRTQQMGRNHLKRRWRRSGTGLATRMLITACFHTSSPYNPPQNNPPLITFSHGAQSCYIRSQIWCFWYLSLGHLHLARFHAPGGPHAPPQSPVKLSHFPGALCRGPAATCYLLHLAISHVMSTPFSWSVQWPKLQGRAWPSACVPSQRGPKFHGDKQMVWSCLNK